MILPRFERYEVNDYGLYPGLGQSGQIGGNFDRGVTLIAGVNGLGKTTLLNLYLRLLTGPFDLSQTGLPNQLGAFLPEKPVRLRPDTLRFFAHRVADQAAGAHATLVVTFAGRRFSVTRNLRDLSLVSFSFDGYTPAVGLGGTEDQYQDALTSAMALSSFVDCLLVLHHVVFFPEGRPGVLWDKQAQKHLLRAVLLPTHDAKQLAATERAVSTADSYFRNVRYMLSTQEKRLAEARAKQSAAPALRAQLEAKQRILDADIHARAALESQKSLIEDQRAEVALDVEKAKIERDDVERNLERLKYTAIHSLFPKNADAALLAVLTLVGRGKCLVCGCQSDDARKAVEEALAAGICPACGSEPEDQEPSILSRIVTVPEIQAAREIADQNKLEEEAHAARLAELDAERTRILKALQDNSNTISAAEFAINGLISELPTPSQEVKSLSEYVDKIRLDLESAKTRLDIQLSLLREMRSHLDGYISRNAKSLIDSFEHHSKELFFEEARLVTERVETNIIQGKSDIRMPVFEAEMTGSSRPGLTRRRNAQDVSESQRELIDLAFRFALLATTGPGRAATILMETPEASLDGIAMEKVGKALNAFASTGDNQLIATSNLTNAGMIAFMFGGQVADANELAARRRRTINLLELARKNQALLQDAAGRYPALLEEALAGS